MKLLLPLALILFYNNIVFCNTTNWEIFKTTYQKIYKNEQEENYRKEIFLKNLQTIEDHNKKYDQGLVSYSLKVNKFVDHTPQELFPSSLPSPQRKLKTLKTPIPKSEVPESIDWRDYGVITPIVDQDFCYSCWAFAVVAALEAHVGIHLGRKNETLSPENLIDCVYSDFDCKDEMERDALEKCYQYIIDNGGIDTSEAYPYDQLPSECRYKPESVGAKIKDYATIPEGDEEELKAVVGTIGPVSVVITADLTFIAYRHGVYYKEDCNDAAEPYNHAVTIVGYGTELEQDYWLVKNEWSELFGENGYIKMARNRDNNCGIASYASYPLVEDSV